MDVHWPPMSSLMRKPWESEAHNETIEISLDLLLPFMSSDEYSSSEEDEDVTEEQVAKYL